MLHAKPFVGLAVAVTIAILAASMHDPAPPATAAPCCLSATSPTTVGFTSTVTFSIQDDISGDSKVTVTASGLGFFFNGGTFPGVGGGADCVPGGVGGRELTYDDGCIDNIDLNTSVNGHFTSVSWLCTAVGTVTLTVTQRTTAGGSATETTSIECVPAPAPGGTAAPARVSLRLSVPAGAVECGSAVFVLAMVTNSAGGPVPDGTPISFLANFGTVNPTATTTLTGAAHAVYTAPPGDTREVVVTAAAGAAFGVVEFRVTCPTPTPSPTPAPTATPSPTTVAPVAGAGTPGAPSAAAATGTAQAAGAAAGTGTGTGVGVGLGTGAPAAIRPPSTGDGGLAAPRPGPAAAIAIPLAAVVIAPILRRRLS